ncbi:hypothetical protein AAHA92_20795 [Salvia divinorum]|uniref:Uncharacterized protein n=1 Tax=Salvia divinorum TaxID=28513 RepID=A0ABD1GIC6_SALDI
MPNNIIEATDETWTSILEKNKLVGAYYYVGEPTFNQLAIMFGPKVLKQKQDKEAKELKSRRKLFYEDQNNGYHELSNEGIKYYYAMAPNESLEKRLLRQPTPLPCQVRGHPPIPKASLAGSSCASSSPIGTRFPPFDLAEALDYYPSEEELM